MTASVRRSVVADVQLQGSLAGTPTIQWTHEDVAEWLDAQGLGMYRPVFLENEINGENLLELGKACGCTCLAPLNDAQDELKELGVTALGHRMSMMKGIELLRKAAP